MSTALVGFIECRLHGTWYAVVDVSLLIPQNYNLYACLFGERNYANFKALFPSRGIPLDASRRVVDEHKNMGEEAHDATWLLFSEYRSKTFVGMTSDGIDPFLHIYKREADGTLVLVDKLARKPQPHPDQFYDSVIKAGELESEGLIYRHMRVPYEEALEGFKTTENIMVLLADQFGAEGVRLVVWFD